MGVIYKFKPEVVDFVIKKKKEAFSLSCRKLAELVFSHFQIKVSKSAINNILSQVSLNSPPKRPAASYGPSKKFQIPEIKKKQLFDVVKKSLAVSVGPSAENLQENVRTPVRANQERPCNENKDAPGKMGEEGLFIFLKAAALEVSMGRYSWLLDAANFDLEKDREKNKSLLMEYNSKKIQAFLEVSSIVVVLEDGREWVFDPRFSTLWEKPEVPSFLSCPGYKAMEWLSSRLISNNQPILLRSVPEESLFDMIVFFEGIGSKAEKILAFSGEAILAEFTTIPSKKRYFSTGVWSSQDEFSEWTKNVQSEKKESFYHTILKKGFCFCDGVDKIDCGKGIELRALTLWEHEESEPFLVILTNQTYDRAEDIIFKYLLRWPKHLTNQNIFGGEDSQCLARASQISLVCEPFSIDKISEDFEQSLYKYCSQHFFPKSIQSFSKDEIKRIFFDVHSKWLVGEGVFYIQLSLPEDYFYRGILQKAVDCINESFVQDELHRRYFGFIV